MCCNEEKAHEIAFRVTRCWLRFIFILTWKHLIALFAKNSSRKKGDRHKSRYINRAVRLMLFLLAHKRAVEGNKPFGIHILLLIYFSYFNSNAIILVCWPSVGTMSLFQQLFLDFWHDKLFKIKLTFYRLVWHAGYKIWCSNCLVFQNEIPQSQVSWSTK